MAAHKGHQKAGGRKAGTPNKVSGEARLKLKDLFDENFDQIREDLQVVGPKIRLQWWSKVLPLIVPRPVEPMEGSNGEIWDYRSVIRQIEHQKN